MREIPRDQRTDRNSKLGTGSEIRAKVDLMAHLQYLGNVNE